MGESAILVKHEKMRTGLSVQPGKAKKDNDKVSCFAQGGSGGTAGHPDGKDNKALVRNYYRKLREDLQNEVNAIADEIGELSKDK